MVLRLYSPQSPVTCKRAPHCYLASVLIRRSDFAKPPQLSGFVPSYPPALQPLDMLPWFPSRFDLTRLCCDSASHMLEDLMDPHRYVTRAESRTF